MNWDDYRYFLAVARSGRLSAAGQQLGVDHATVGRRVKSLEKNLGALLFDRSPQGYSLTDAGIRLVSVAETMESETISAQAKMGAEQQTISGIIRIGASEGIATAVLARCAGELCRQHPLLEIQIVAMPRTFSLSKREADIAITLSPPTSGRLKFRKISDYKLHMYGTEKYLENHEKIQTIEDLTKVRGIGYVNDLIYDKELDYVPLVSPDIKPHLTSTSVHVQLEATLADAGVCILHDFMAAPYTQLQKVLPEQISFTRSFWYVVHEDYAKLERVRVVSEAIIESIKKKLTELEESP